MITIPQWLKAYLETIESADQKKIIHAIIGIIIVMTLVTIFYGWRYISVTRTLTRSLRVLNDQREEARILREKMLRVHNQRTAVDQMLAQEPDFKIGGYVAFLLQKLKLSDKKRLEETSQADVQENYRETEVMLKLGDMNMQNLVELLYAIEQKQRIYIKRLEIERSKKQPSSIDVQLAIATLIAS
jgi:hypothetical protein